MNAVALILAGGEGVRFKPLSTPEKPKQFIRLTDSSQSLLQQTYGRLSGLFEPANVWVATNQRYVPLVREQLPQILPSQIFGETEKKNTAPCLAWSCYQIFKNNPLSVVAALPSDHFITPTALFERTLEQAQELAEQEKTIVTLGIRPTHPSTQYGYIHCEEDDEEVEAFVEKPNAETAQKYFEDGNYFWNSGIFIFPASKMLLEIQRYLPELFELLKTENSLEDFFAKAPSISIDYGVMEKSKNLRMLKAPFTWSDVGTWENLKILAAQHLLDLPPEVKKYF